MILQKSLAARITALIFLATSGILAAVALVDYFAARRMLEDELRSRAVHVARATARELQVVATGVEKLVAELAVALERCSPSAAEVYPLLEATLREHGEVFGSAVVFDPEGGAPGRAPASIPYVYRAGGALARKDLAAGGYPFAAFDWYTLPRERRAPVWTEPYFDEGGGERLMVTYSSPIIDSSGGRLLGLVTADLALDWLKETLAAMDVGSGGFAFLVSGKGTIISHPESRFILRESLFSIAERFRSGWLRQVAESMVRGESGFGEFTGFEQPVAYWGAYAPVPNTGWSLAAQFPKSQITAKVLDLSRLNAFLAIGGVLGMIAVALWIAHSVSRPIQTLDAATRVLAAGDLDAPLPAPRGEDEVARLTESFSRMREDLKRHIKELEETTAAKTRIENELQIARKIQLDLLPMEFSFDPPRPQIELHAILEPAREVGGDFYEFFLSDPRRLFLAVGDVSGKGIPASLFMAVSKAYLKAFVKEGLDPAAALARLNDELAPENDEGMFLTVFCCSLDLDTGECRYASGGHNPPFILRASGRVEALPAVKGPLIGLDGGRSFDSGSFRLESGDLLLAYSDGLVEAENESQDLYGEDRSASTLLRHLGERPRQILEALRADLRLFVGRAPQSDDITLLGVLFRPPSKA
jgi:sigma-B regulation protein RsbU (phosphoserine phosphatase)